MIYYPPPKKEVPKIKDRSNWKPNCVGNMVKRGKERYNKSQYKLATLLLMGEPPDKKTMVLAGYSASDPKSVMASESFPNALADAAMDTNVIMNKTFEEIKKRDLSTWTNSELIRMFTATIGATKSLSEVMDKINEKKNPATNKLRTLILNQTITPTPIVNIEEPPKEEEQF